MRDLPEFDLSRFLPYRMTVAAERLSAGMARRYRAEFGISVAEWRVLVHLADGGEVSIRDLEARVNLEKSKASRAAARLAADGYVTKVPNAQDRRLVSLSLSDKGRALMADLIPRALAFQERLDRLLAAERAALDAALDAILTEDL
ncbi:MarR family winged helix-turn-helix transcriptional regulator [Roseivivax isoporae]|nr:MarR family winged helix-turn-helix transcriptional regulator [Roseivivax isoporae]